MKAVFLDQQTFIPSISMDVIADQLDNLTLYPTTQACDVLKRCCDVDVIITNKVIINSDIMAKLPKLKLICVAATGTNNIDINAAKKHNIVVMNVAGYSTSSVSQYVFTGLLNFFTKTAENSQKANRGEWSNSQTFCIHASKFDELSSKTIGLVGYGDIAKQIEKVAIAFGMKVLIAERLNHQPIRTGRVSFDAMLEQADIVSLHCPQTPDTEKLFSHSVFEKMQSHALLINTARGAIIDEDALAYALKNHLIGGAILDVLTQEPPSSEHILLQSMPSNLIVTAHIAWSSQQAQQKLINLIAQNIAKFKSM